MRSLITWALCLVGSVVCAEDGYRVGVAKVDITPEHAIRLNGFGSRRTESEGVYQRIYAKALAIEDASHEPVLLITLDVLGIPSDLRREVAARLAKKTGLKPDRLCITATHTHTGPMLTGANVTLFGTPIPKEHLANIDRYTKVFLDKLEQVGTQALAKRQQATLAYGIGTVTFAKNRRTAGGPVDHDLPVIFVKDGKGKVIAVYTSYATHCVTLSHNKIGGDWAGFAQEAIQDAFPEAVALVSIGCGADSNPSSGVTGDKLEAAKFQGRDIAAEVQRLAKNHLTPIIGKIAVQTKNIELPLGPLPTKAQWEEKAKRMDAIGHHARVQLEKLADGKTLATKVDYPVSTWSFGNTLGMVFLPGEVVVDYSLRLKKELDGQRLWVNAYANDAPCYIPSERVLKEGGYEGGGAMVYYDQPVPFKPGLEEAIIGTVHDQLGKTFTAKYDTRRTGGTLALSPLQSLATIQTKPDLRVELVAAEPFVVDPVAIDFGPGGQVWVAEMVDYPLGKQGQLEPGGRIRLLQMVDGRVHKATVFLDAIPFPTGVTVWRKGVLICAAPDILYAEDTDGDGVADHVKKLFSGFGTENYQGRVNSLQYGLDGWVYGSCGLFGGKIKSFNGKVYALGDRDFRIKPDSGELEPVTGRTQQGRVRNDAGDWFGCDNSTLLRHYVGVEHYLRRNPHVPTPEGAVFVPEGPNANRLFARKPDAQRFKLSGPPNMVTAACGLGIYRDTVMGKEYAGNAFTCEPVNMVVHRRVLHERRSTFTGARSADEQESEWLASTDNWFRPVQAVTGPDGALWIVDMYRYVIEHPRWIPKEDAVNLDLRAGQGMGRLFRVTAANAAPPTWPHLTNLDTAGLVNALDTANGWQRDMAMMLLMWQADANAAPLLVKRLKHERPETRLQALVCLDGLGQLQAEHVQTTLADASPSVLRQAVRLAEQFPTNAALRTAVARLATHPHPQVRLQVAYSLGVFQGEVSVQALASLLEHGGDDPHLFAAAMSSLHQENLSPVLAAVLRTTQASGPPTKFVQAALRMATSLKDDTVRATLLAAATQANKGQYAPWQNAIVGSLGGTTLTPELTAKVATMTTAARRLFDDPQASEAARIAALPLLGRAPNTDRDLFRRLLSPTTSPELRAAAINHLGTLPDAPVTALFLESWRGQPPTTRAVMLDLLLSQHTTTLQLLEAIEQKTVAPAEIDAARRQRLLTHTDGPIRQRAARLFDGASNPDRAKVLREYSNVNSGDRTRGKAVFTKVCSACHKLDGIGTNVGPDLAAVTNRTASYLLQEILDPNRNVDARYVEYRVLTNRGRVSAGQLAAETATTIILRGQQGKEETLLRTEIDELRSSGKSLMPEGLEKDLPKNDMADLLAYLSSTRPPRRHFPGNEPTLITSTDGQLVLRAVHAELYGTAVELEREFNNLGMWHGLNDTAEWRIRVPKATTVDVYFDFACATGAHGNPIIVEVGTSTLRATVPSTTSWSQYRTQKFGTLQVPAGESRVVVRADGRLQGALIDLRTLFMVPEGQAPKSVQAPIPPDPTEAASIAKLLLDDAQSRDRRDRLLTNNAHQSAALLQALVADLKDDAKEEYRRIPWVWRVAIAAGKRNDAKELRILLEVALPAKDQTLRHWQAVVVGGGIINGLSQVGVWPGKRLAEIIGDDKALADRWAQALKQSFTMADAESVPKGTRYDALRMLALAAPSAAEPILTKYLPKGTDAELQMGAISGLSDVASPNVAPLLLKHLGALPATNFTLAFDALLRTDDRTEALMKALEQGAVQASWLPPAQRAKLLKHPNEAIHTRAAKLFGQ